MIITLKSNYLKSKLMTRITSITHGGLNICYSQVNLVYTEFRNIYTKFFMS